MVDSASAIVIAIVVIGFLLSFLVSVGIGANDVANSFGSVHGTKSLKLRYIILLSIIFESLGAFTIGAVVVKAIRNNVISLEDIQRAYIASGNCRHPAMYGSDRYSVMIFNGISLSCAEMIHLLGNISILSACVISLFFANLFKFPVSATHVIIGATVGYGVVALKGQHIKWIQLARIAGSWVLSPIIAGLFAALICYFLDIFMIKKRNLKTSLNILWFLYFFAILVFSFPILFMIFLNFNDRKFIYLGPILSASGSLILSSVVFFPLIHFLKKKAKRLELDQDKGIKTSTPSISTLPPQNSEEKVEIQDAPAFEGGYVISHLVTILQVMTACNKSFAHGGNDISNSVAPLISIWLIYQHGSLASVAASNIYLIAFGVLGIAIGVIFWGKRVLETIGKSITKITPVSGLSIELSSSTTVVGMTLLGLPISTTHCTVGSTVAVGWLRHGFKTIDIKLLISIGICWIVSIPIPALLSASTFCICRALMFGVGV
ncbi:hypothetical protein HZS_1315 [Henneguya salminicola]|nr:hypothetical protein HZS_1315 [Henneguya salminicola]